MNESDTAFFVAVCVLLVITEWLLKPLKKKNKNKSQSPEGGIDRRPGV